MRYIPFLILFLITNLIISQNDEIGYKITYTLNYKPDSTNLQKIYSEHFLLFGTTKKSKFISKSHYLADSLIFDAQTTGKNPSLIISAAINIPHTKFQFAVYKNFNKQKLIVYDQIFTDIFKYEEKLGFINWKIENETKKINDFNCQLATTKYGGRKYMAWFTNEVNINDGPYKFSGLPGLIIELSDTKKHYIFTLNSIKEGPVDITENRTKETVINTTKQKYFKALHDFNENKDIRIKNNPNFNFNTGKKKKKKKLFNNPIELNFTN